ncbi:hypothetical protein H9P43_007868 [Blastocladiella emersonii ATCC 22665]|nr:hypothetical protein H9P43_007868 [Blastocladiella emersonii ATCC 22665]
MLTTTSGSGTGSALAFEYPLLAHPTIPARYHRQVGLVRDVITAEEEQFLAGLCQRKQKRAAFQSAHFDKVISGYREMSASHWRVGIPAAVAEANEQRARGILARCYALLDAERERAFREEGQPKPAPWLAEHILELDANGTIGAHVDHLTASGTMVAALSLLSATPVVFQHTSEPEWTFSVVAEPRSLYFQRDELRYDFTHAVPKPAGAHRISIMFRDRYTVPHPAVAGRADGVSKVKAMIG